MTAPSRTKAPTAPSSVSFGLTLRCRYPNLPGMLARVAGAVGDAGGDLRGIEIVAVDDGWMTRDLTVHTCDDDHAKWVRRAVADIPEVEVLEHHDRTFRLHEGGKITITPKAPLRNLDDLSMVYTPGVARVSEAIAEDRGLAREFTIKANTVAVVTDGSAVLGLGDIGPEAALPVMEGKAMLFKEFSGVDAFPICLDAHQADEIVEAVERIAPVFGGINLEDISAPRCFEVEDRLKAALDIPVFHDDQHGTAVVVLAALINAANLVGKRFGDLKAVICGMGAAGVATAKILHLVEVGEIIGADRRGAIHGARSDLTQGKRWCAENTNPSGMDGDLSDLIKGADVFIGLSSGGLLSSDDVANMAPAPIVFAMAIPEPEIRPEAIRGLAAVVATGRSDYPNQINNVLCFPGFFRGLLDSGATDVTEEMKVAAAWAIAGVIPEDRLAEGMIVPSVFDPLVAAAVAEAVATEALRASPG